DRLVPARGASVHGTGPPRPAGGRGQGHRLPVLGRRELRQRLELSRRRRIRRNDLGPRRPRTPPADTAEMTGRGANDMAESRYVIIGGSMAADSGARGIREVDAQGSIAIISDDVDEPYPRPALSKRLLTDEGFDE